jgi:hypothetical protein
VENAANEHADHFSAGDSAMLWMLSLLTLSCLLAPLAATAAEIKAKVIAKGSLADATLTIAAPTNGVVATPKDLEQLCKAWKIEAPKVDFTKELVIVGTTVGSQLSLNAKLNDGNLVVNFLATSDFGEGFRYLFATCPRDGVKKVNGIDLKSE